MPVAGSTRPTPRPTSLDDLVGEGQQRLRQGEAGRVCRFEVDDEFEFGGLIDRDLTRFNAAKDLVHIVGNLSRRFGGIGPIGHQPATISVKTAWIDRRQPLVRRKLNNSSAKPSGNDDGIWGLFEESIRQTTIFLGAGLFDRHTFYRQP